MILLDTNIILRSKQVGSYHHKEVTEKLIELINRILNVISQISN